MPPCGGPHRAKRRELETRFRLQVGAEIQRRRAGRQRVAKGVIEDLARRFETSCRTIETIGRQFRNAIDDPAGMNLSRRRQGNCGRPKIWQEQSIVRVEKIAPHNRRTIRGMAMDAKIPKTSLHRVLKEMGCRNTRRWIKPLLNKEQRVARVRWVVSHVSGDRRNTHFNDMRFVVHVDEKWFYAMKDGSRVWLLPTEDRIPPPQTQNKGSIPKVMFIAAVARPQKRPDGTWFDGLVGIWPFVETVLAQRSSKNRPRGAPELKPINVTGEVFCSYMVNKVLPAVRKQFWHAKTSVVIQLDGARPHWKASIQPELEAALHFEGFKIKLVQQPSNSPDLNVLDLGFFSSLQRSSDRIRFGGSIEDIVSNTMKAFESYPWETLERVWRSLFAVMACILAENGSNAFDLPHVGKEAEKNAGEAVWEVPVRSGLVIDAARFLRDADKD